MKNSMLTLIHVLGVDTPTDGTIKARATVRAGSPAIGDRLSFTASDGERHQLKIVSIEHSTRWSTIVLVGAAKALRVLVTGTYLQSISEVTPARIARPWWPAPSDSGAGRIA